MEFFASNSSSRPAAREIDQTTVVITFGGKSQRFIVSQNNHVFKTLVLNEFLLSPQSDVGLCTHTGDEKLVLPFEVGLLRNNATYELKVYAHQFVPPPPHHVVAASMQQQSQRHQGGGVVQMDVEDVSISSSSHNHPPPVHPQHSQHGQGGGHQRGQGAGGSNSQKSDHSSPSQNSRKVAPQPPPPQPVTAGTAGGSGDQNPESVVAAYDYMPTSSSELKISEGDVIQVTQKYNDMWWEGTKNGEKGFFPTNYVKLSGSSQLLSDQLGGGNGSSQQTADYDLQDDEYFEGYANLQIHWEMLRDTSRTLAYKKGISELAKHIKGKIVMDVGCGSGVLSIFCAQMGAKHVYAIDASDILKHAQKVVELNGLKDKISLVSGKIESVSVPVEKVDVIVSEWMGTMLICESMIASVLTARDRFLRPGGLMIPGESTLFLCPLSCPDYYEEKVDFWDNVYNINMGCLKQTAHDEFFGRPVFSRVIPENEMIAAPAEIFTMDMHEATEEELENILSAFKFEITKEGKLHGFGAWFSVSFCSRTEEGKNEKGIELNTSPAHKETHWKQVIFLFDNAPCVKVGSIVEGVMTIERNKYWRRHFEVVLKFSIQGNSKSWQKRFPVWR